MQFKRNNNFLKLSPQNKKILRYIEKNGDISARGALLDLDITSATLSSRMCELDCCGYKVTRDRKTHPATGKQYTSYSVEEKEGNISSTERMSGEEHAA